MSHLLLSIDTRWFVTATKVTLRVVGCYALFWIWKRQEFQEFQNTDFLPPAEDQRWPQQISTDSFKNRTLSFFQDGFGMILLERRGVNQVTFQDLLYPLILGFYELCSLDNLTQCSLSIYISRTDLHPKFYTKANTISLGSFLLLSI